MDPLGKNSWKATGGGAGNEHEFQYAGFSIVPQRNMNQL